MIFFFLAILFAAPPAPPAHYLDQWKTVRRDDCAEVLFLAGRLKKYQHKFAPKDQELVLFCEKQIFPVKGFGEVGPNNVFLVPAKDALSHHPENRRVLIPDGLWYFGYVLYLADFARLQFAALPDAEKIRNTPDFTFGKYLPKAAFIIETREHPVSEKSPGKPRVQVSFDEAREICRKAGGDLPDEHQWEIAARGASYYRPFPFGESIPVPCFGQSGPKCASVKTGLDLSPWGLWNLGSGVAEWVLPSPSRPVPAAMAITKGGTTGDHFYWNLVAARRLVSAQTRSDAIGFRCVFPVKNPSVP